MLQALQQRAYRRLFGAQIVALLGTGLATVALGLLAFELAGDRAGMVLGTALAIKMLAYVGLAPIAGALAERFPRRPMLVVLDLIRMAVACFLPFVTAIWQIYLLIFILQAASAAFTPTFQATIPDILPQEKEYTQALSLSRLAYDLENLVSPALAALLLGLLSFEQLFWGTALGFGASAALVLSVQLPAHQAHTHQAFSERLSRGLRLYWATPRLRGLWAVCLCVAAAGSMVIVNTVVLIQGNLQLTQEHTAWALTAFGAGSMLAALALPQLLERYPDRPVMLLGCVGLVLGLLASALLRDYTGLVCVWALLGLCYSAAQTPSGRLLKRSVYPEDRPAIFAAHFALSHACWLLSYPLAGGLGARSLGLAAWVLAGMSLLGTLLALRLWPRDDAEVRWHSHPELPPDHPHLQEGQRQGQSHSHAFVVDALHSYDELKS